MLIKMFVSKSIALIWAHIKLESYVFPVRPTVIETAVYVNSIGPVDPINMVSLQIYSDIVYLYHIVYFILF